MSTAEEAFEFAKTMIEEARISGANKLDFDVEETRVLERLPESVRTLDGLKILKLKDTRVADLSVLRNFDQLEEIYMTGTPVDDISILASCRNLRILYAAGTLVDDLSPLGELAPLSKLSLNRIPASKFAPLENCKHLKHLYLADTKIADLSPLTDFKKLEVLVVPRTNVHDVEALKELRNLRQLTLNRTNVLDLRPLQKLNRLVTEPYLTGLSFAETLAAKMDDEINEVSEIGAASERARALFEYLKKLASPMVGANLVRNGIQFPPIQLSAPIIAEWRDGILQETSLPKKLNDDDEVLAKEGWKALKEFFDDVEKTLRKDNLPNLKRAIDAFGRALGESFDEMHPISLGIHGQRIIEISRTSDEILLEDAAPDLVAFAAGISKMMPRFPTWREFLRATSATRVETPIKEAVEPVREINEILKKATDVSEKLSQSLEDLASLAEDDGVSSQLRTRGLLASLSNIFSQIGSFALNYASDANRQLYIAVTKAPAVGVIGVATYIFFNKGELLIKLAEMFPSMLGWLKMDLSRYSSVSLNWFTTIKENDYGTSPHRRISSRSCPNCIDERAFA